MLPQLGDKRAILPTKNLKNVKNRKKTTIPDDPHNYI